MFILLHTICVWSTQIVLHQKQACWCLKRYDNDSCDLVVERSPREREVICLTES